ncbi:Adenylate and Guanylate cyclase catalytic domain containing protein [Tritrichomonas foetus]|uniref:Adenylate and Guanylate cyclase catalytic domain containing protein n=1 Tax=Tritrichomonas foetus TaxID=1144522 RepID=A0A1J4KNI7_9EUKA|nr:Adenylate and Guanylate cyclase catalytic domain containing protein [Tritrichomonas foetus]|eukprot:OHT11356.1 Adenylate and Guanylate cyclase catalytic domain containing protein [Tritrichomonas foetus]
MNAPPADSQCSKSLTIAGSSGLRNKLVSGQYAVVDRVFPLFDHIFQQGDFPKIIPFIVTLYTSLQIMFVGLWPEINFWRLSSGNILDALNILSKIFFFIPAKLSFYPETSIFQNYSSMNNYSGDSLNNNFDPNNPEYILYNNNENDSIMITFICVLVIFLISFVSIVGHIFYSAIAHRYLKWLLYFNRFVSDYICQIMIIPSAALVGSSLLMLCHGMSMSNIAYVVVGAIMNVYFLYTYTLTTKLSTKSTIISVTVKSTFDCDPIINTFITHSIFIILGYLFQYFPTWVFTVLQIIYLSLNIYFNIHVIVFMPFHSLIGNIFFAATGITNAALTFCMIFPPLLSAISNKTLIFLCCWPVIFIISLIVLIVVNIRRYKQIIKNLTKIKDDDSETSQEEIHSSFDKLGLNKSEDKALCYERIGFANICPYFIDWSLLKYMAMMYNSNKIYCFQIQLLSYFPSELRQMDQYFNIIITKNNLKFDERFLIYQVNRLKVMRHSTTCSEANERYLKLRGMSDECLSNVLGFWRSPNPDISYFEALSSNMQKLDSLWMESIRNYPNSTKFYEMYRKFLTECRTDFRKAIIIKERSDMVDLGKTFTIDKTFRSMVRSFPDYIKKKIVDGKGNFIQNENSGNDQSHSGATSASTSISLSNSSSSDVSTSSEFSLSDDKEMDAEVEGTLASSMFTFSKLRMALYHALKGRTHGSINSINFAVVISLILSITCFIGFYFYIQKKYEERADSMSLLSSLTYTRIYSELSITSLILDYVKYHGGLITDIGYFDDITPLIDLSSSLNRDALIQSLQSNRNFGELLVKVSSISAEGINVYEVASRFLNPINDFTTCWNGIPVDSKEQNLKNLYTYLYYLHQRCAAVTRDDFLLSNHFCELHENNFWAVSGSQNLSDSVTNFQVHATDDLVNLSRFIMIIIPIAIILISFCPIMGLSLWFVHHCDVMAKALSELSRDIKEQAISPIGKHFQAEETSISEPKLRITKMVFFNIMILILSIVTAVLFLMMVYVANTGIHGISQILMWENLASKRVIYAVEIMNFAIYAIILHDPNNMPSYTNRSIEIERIYDSFAILDQAGTDLTSGNNQSKPFGGQYSILDSIMTTEQCVINYDTENIHDTYRCGSVSHLLSAYHDMIANIVADLDRFSGSLSDEYPTNLIHIVNYHIVPLMQEFIYQCDKLVTSNFNKLLKTSMILMIVGIILSLVILVYGLVIESFARNTYTTALSIFKRIPPIQMIQNKKIRDLLLNRNGSHTTASSSFARSILHKSGDAMLCTSLNGIIEIVNPYITKTFGYSPDQLLGQSVGVLFKDDNVLNQMEMMREGRISSLYEDQQICVRDNENQIPVHTTIIGIKKDESTNVESFVFILRDNSDRVNQQKCAEDAKAQSEYLLFQILPRDIVFKLNRGEKEISFTVPSASIIFIDIVQFSAYSANLNPQEIMGNLSMIFASFDNQIKKYTLLTKIKLIGDVYMAAAGLFATEDVSSEHATQTVKFGQDIITELDEINVKLNSNLQVRVGVNSGGPLIGGVLGTDKPVFDIIGDPINVASRLQSTDIPGKVQISQNTCDLLNQTEFSIEPRGEVFLKGKGKVNTFLVTPASSTFSFEISVRT